jgi:hypothetical protein
VVAGARYDLVGDTQGRPFMGGVDESRGFGVISAGTGRPAAGERVLLP